MNHLRFLQLARAHSPDIEGSGGSGAPGPQSPASVEPQTFSIEYVRELRAENKGWRLKVAEMEKAANEARAAAEKANADASAASEKAAKDAEAKIADASNAASQRIIRAELRAQAVKAGMHDLDGLKLLDTSAVKLGEDGEVAIPEDFFAKAREAKPYLFTQSGADAGKTSQTRPAPAPVPASGKRAEEMSADEYAAELARLTGARR